MKHLLAPCQERRCVWHVLLLPLAALFLLLSLLRRQAYRLHLLPVRRLPVPVIVVGNITAGGTGKTPLVLWLVQLLRDAGHHPGVISRGYGGRLPGPAAVTSVSDPSLVGDEPLLIARRAGCPVWIGRRRAKAGRALLATHPQVDVLVADDGLQHYALARDLEIAVVDGERRFGNGWPLPAGPLREALGRLETVDAVVVHGGATDWLRIATPVSTMRLQPRRLRALATADRHADLASLAGRQVHAVAGIGHPARFFATLRGLGAAVREHPFPDHHAFRPEDLPQGTLVMTEKDAVKCAGFPVEDAWVLEVDAVVSGGLKQLILNHASLCNGQ